MRELVQVGACASASCVPGGGEIEKVLQHQMTVLGGDAFGMKLHAMHRQTVMN